MKNIAMRIYKSLLIGVISLIFVAGFVNFAHAQSSKSTDPKSASKSEDDDAKLTPSPTPLVPKETPPSGINLTLAPTFLNLVTDPGEEVTSQIKVKNNNNFSEYLKIDIAKFESAEGGERPLISEFTSADDYKNWISFSDSQFILDPNETKVIDVTIRPPKEASLGYYYAIIVNRTTQQETVAQGAAVAGAPAILTLLEVRSENAKRELQLVDFKTKKFFYEYLPAEFEVKVKNTGNIHITPTGDIFIDSIRAKDVGILRANEGRGNVLPGTERVYTVSWNDGFAVKGIQEENGQVVKDKDGQAKLKTKFDFTKANKFRMGKYTASVLLVYDNGERDIPLEGTVTFWIIPWKMLLVGGVILIFAILGIKNTVITNLKKIIGKR